MNLGASGYFVGKGVATGSASTAVLGALGGALNVGAWNKVVGGGGVSKSVPSTPGDALRRGIPSKTAGISAEEAAKWERHLNRHGVSIKHEQDDMLDKVGAEALYNPNNKTIYLRTNPSKSAFLEEAFHAKQDLYNLPDFTEYNGKIIDRWEFEAQRSLIRNRHRLGITNDQTRDTIQNLREVYNGSY